jgi:hypothetical protein
LAWAIAMLVAALGIVAAVVAVPLYLLVGRNAVIVTLSVAAGLAVLSLAPAAVFLWKWRR